MSSARARRCSTRSARKAARGSSPRRPSAPTAASAPRTGSRSSASSGRNSSSSAGRTATSAAASARCTSPSATAASSPMPARSAPASTRKMIHDLERADAAARGRRTARWTCPAPARRGSHWIKPEAGRRDRLHRIHRRMARCATRASSRCARTRRPGRWCCEKPQKLPKTAGKRRSRAAAGSSGSRSAIPTGSSIPGDGLTKGELADYYAAVAALMLVDMAKRPISLVRCPQGRAQAMLLPEARQRRRWAPHVHHVPIKESDGDVEDYLYVEDARGILACVQMGTIEFHGWGSKVDKLEKPDRLVFDLDPDEGLDFDRGEGGARPAPRPARRPRARDLPDADRRQGHPRHRAARPAKADWPAVKSFAERFSRAIAEAEPELFTANIRKAKRKGRIFLDWLRNQRGATAVMPYSARAREGAPVAAPIAWEELDQVQERRTPSRSAMRTSCSSGPAPGARRLGQGEAEAAQGLTWLERRAHSKGAMRSSAPAARPSRSSPPLRPPRFADGERQAAQVTHHPRRFRHRPYRGHDRRRCGVRHDLCPGRGRFSADRGQLSDRAGPHRRSRWRKRDLAGSSRPALRQRERS